MTPFQIIHPKSEPDPENDRHEIKIEDDDSNEVIAAKGLILVHALIKGRRTFNAEDLRIMRDIEPWVESAFEVLKARDLL